MGARGAGRSTQSMVGRDPPYVCPGRCGRAVGFEAIRPDARDRTAQRAVARLVVGQRKKPGVLSNPGPFISFSQPTLLATTAAATVAIVVAAVVAAGDLDRDGLRHHVADLNLDLLLDAHRDADLVGLRLFFRDLLADLEVPRAGFRLTDGHVVGVFLLFLNLLANLVGAGAGLGLTDSHVVRVLLLLLNLLADLVGTGAGFGLTD